MKTYTIDARNTEQFFSALNDMEDLLTNDEQIIIYVICSKISPYTADCVFGDFLIWMRHHLRYAYNRMHHTSLKGGYCISFDNKRIFI